MAVDTVIDANEILLNGILYPITRPVQAVLASMYPPKVVIGDTSRDSQQRLSVLALSKWTGGIGLERKLDAANAERAWWSTCQLRYDGHLVLPPLATTTAASGASGSFTVGAINEHDGSIYAAFGVDVRKYNNTSDSWGSSLATLPAAATDSINYMFGTTEYIAFATTGGYTYSTDGSSWTNDTTNTKYLAFWDDRLWGIDNAGQLWFSLSAGAEANDAKLPLPAGNVTDLFVARDASGNPILYASTKRGLWAHDSDNERFIETELKLPVHPNAGTGTAKWRDSIYYPAGLGIYKYINGSTSAVITIVGPDKDHGLPADKRGTIRQLIPTHNDLLAILDSTTAPGSLDNYAQGQSFVIPADTGFSVILGWNELGWEVKWLGGDSDKAIDTAHVSDVYSKYRLWWAANERIHYMDLPKDIINPDEVSDFTYAASGDHETPWFDAGQTEVDKLAVKLKVDCASMSSTETITVYYGVDFASGYTQLAEITSDGVTSFTFPDNGTNPDVGKVFRSIRFKVSLARGSTTTVSPDMLSITLEYRKKLETKWGHAIGLILKDYKGYTAEELRAYLITAIESQTLVQFTFRDPDKLASKTYYVDIASVTGLEFTGHDERGNVNLMVVEA